MRQFIDVTGKTEDEAIQNALRQLGLDRDDVSVEILERAKSGFLGLGSCPAKVRVSYGPEEEEEVLAPAPAPKEKPQEERPKPPKAEKPPRQERKPAEAPAPAPEEKTRQSAPVQTLGEEVDDEKAQAIRKFLSGLLEQMDGLWIIEVVLPTGSGLVLPQALQCQVSLLSQGVEGAVVVPLHCGGHLLQADAPHP